MSCVCSDPTKGVKLITKLPDLGALTKHLLFSPDGQFLMTSTISGHVQLWNAATDLWQSLTDVTIKLHPASYGTPPLTSTGRPRSWKVTRHPSRTPHSLRTRGSWRQRPWRWLSTCGTWQRPGDSMPLGTVRSTALASSLTTFLWWEKPRATGDISGLLRDFMPITGGTGTQARA